MRKKIKSALISVYYKDQLQPLLETLHKNGVKLYSTGGTQQFIQSLKIPVTSVESLTTYPSILGGRVKTLHPAVFGGILARRENPEDIRQLEMYSIPEIDLVVVDLYPFSQTVASGADDQDIIEKIDIGGVSLIRAAAKNFHDTVVISSKAQYSVLNDILQQKQGATDTEDRRMFATQAFDITSDYDSAIFNYFNQSLPSASAQPAHKQSLRNGKTLRYGENPHQRGFFYGELDDLLEQLHGKELSYNNLLDIDAGIGLIDEFPAKNGPAFAILKHNNACGMAVATSCAKAYEMALQADPVSAFGGVLLSNTEVDADAAKLMNDLFFEILVAPSFSEEALSILKTKKNRILLLRKPAPLPNMIYKTLLNGVLAQDKDAYTETKEDLKVVTQVAPTNDQIEALLFANKLVKHTKSNAIIFASHNQLFASGTGQTSRVDALRQAIHKAKSFGFDLSQSVMASDAFFPFPDCVEIAHQEGVKAVIQPGGSIRDQDSIDACNRFGMAMVCTGYRHFKH